MLVRRSSRSVSAPGMAGMAVLLALSFAGRSQVSEQPPFFIEVRSVSPLSRQLIAEIQDQSRRKVAEAMLRGDDQFEFRGVPSGQYWLVVADGNGNMLSQTPISVTPGVGNMILEVATPKPERPPSGGVSVSELRKPASREAVRAVVAAQKQSAAGHDDKAVELLEKAIRISPDYVGAYTNLTAAYVRLGKIGQAIATAQRAVDLGSSQASGKPNAADLSNLAYAQYLGKRFAEAVANSRRALELAPESAKAHLVLGGALAAGGGDLQEAARHLEFAARTLPSAQPALEAVRQRLARTSAVATQAAQR